MRFANGSTQPLPGPWTVRQTEYTAGISAAMPAELPPTSGYTYAAELRSTRREAAGASSVEFTRRAPARSCRQVRRELHPRTGRQRTSRPVPTTATRPSGRRAGRARRQGGLRDGGPWRTSTPTATATATAADYPAALKITDGERTALAPLYPPGAELFRVPVEHFSPGDYNWAAAFPPGARLPRLGPDGEPIPDGCPQPASSTIDCEDQRLREEIAGAGHAVLAVVLVRLGAERGRPQAQERLWEAVGPSEPARSCACRCRSRVARTCGATPARRTRATTHRRWCPDLERRSTGTGSTPTASPSDRQGQRHALLLLRGRLRDRRSGRHLRRLRRGRGDVVPRPRVGHPTTIIATAVVVTRRPACSGRSAGARPGSAAGTSTSTTSTTR